MLARLLKNSPRLITFGLICLFSLPIAIRNIAFLLGQAHEISAGRGESEDAAIRSRQKLTSEINEYGRVFAWLDRVDFDFHLSRGTDAIRVHPDVTIVEVGEKSLHDLGQFPFTRTIYKGLLERLEKAGARVVAFDATFPEHDARIDILNELRALRHEIEQREGFDSPAVQDIDRRIFAIDADEDFATALHNARLPVVLGFTFGIDEADPGKIAPEVQEAFRHYDLHRRDYLMNGALFSKTWYLPVLSIGQLLNSLNDRGSIGHFNPDPDDDGMIRRVPAVLEYNGRILASLAVRAVAAYYGEDLLVDGASGLTIRGVTRDATGGEHDGRLSFPLSSGGDFILRFYGSGRTFPYTEFSDVVKGRFTDEELRARFGGKIVFVGVTAAGLKDMRATPLSPNYPGVETHATLASNVLSQTFLVLDYRFFLFGYLFLLLFGGLVGWAVFHRQPLTSFSVALGSAVAIQLATQYGFFNHGVVVPSILPSFCCLSIFFTGVLYRYFTEQREKKAVRAAFSRYVSSAVVEEILKDQSKLRLGGQKKPLTVMFVDLVEFTKLSEHMDAAFVTQLLNEYFTRMTSVLLRNKGTLDKYMGDALMCFWGAPLEIADHARLACVTALEMRAELERINQDWKARHGITIENRIGIHTGVVSVGNMGSDQVFSYTAMGDSVNLASRLEGVNTVYGTHIVVSAATAAEARNGDAAIKGEPSGPGLLFRPLDRVQVKGKVEEVEILELVCAAGREGEPEWVHAFRTGLAHYRAGEWDDAERAFRTCLALRPGDAPSAVFVDRIRDFRAAAPGGWRGVWKLSSK